MHWLTGLRLSAGVLSGQGSGDDVMDRCALRHWHTIKQVCAPCCFNLRHNVAHHRDTLTVHLESYVEVYARNALRGAVAQVGTFLARCLCSTC
jgi:hypothetical protein